MIGGQALLVGQIRFPADVAGLMVADQYRPLGAGQLDHLGRDRAVGSDDPARATAPHVRPGIAGVLKDSHDPRVRQRAPAKLAAPRPTPDTFGEPPTCKRADDAVRRSGLLECGEQVGDRGLDLLVGVDDRLALLVVEVADCEREAQLAALSGGAFGALQARRDDVQLGLGTSRL